jgi:uncharacterized protein
VPNPFVYSHPLPPSELIDREAEATRLLQLAEGAHNSRLTAPRRFGKTTVAQKVLADAERIGMNTVYVNFYGILSLEDASNRIERAYRESLQGALRGWAVGAIRSLRPTLSPPGTGLEISPEVDQEVARRLYSLLDLPVRLFKRQANRTLIVLDEFQEVLDVKQGLDGIIRSRIELHHDEASYIFAGSHPGMMAQLFGDRSRPFYGQTSSVQLARLSDEDLAEYIASRFASTNREVGDVLEPVLAIAQGHPQRAMLLAHHLWDATSPGRTADEDSWTGALESVYGELKDELVITWDSLDDSERRVLAAVASRAPLSSKATLEHYEVARATARDARARLISNGFLENEGDRVRVVDPLLALWVAHDRQGLLGD